MKPVLPLLALGLGLAGAAQADEPVFSVSGYGTLAWTQMSGDNAQYRVGTAEPNGAGHAGSGEADSKLGVQIIARPTDKFSATLHLLSKKNEHNNFNPRVEWAYGKYDLTPDVSLRAGRLALPGFVLSDYLNVGYSMTPVRGPVEVYAQLPISHFNGVDALWRTQAGPLALTVQPFAGRSNIHARFSDPQATRAEGDATVYGMNLVGQWDDWSLRIGRIDAKVSLNAGPVDSLISTLRMMGENGAASRLEYQDKHSSFTGLGVGYDNGKLLAQGEYTIRKAGGFLADTTGWYVMAGWRFGNVTPYVMTARQRVTSDTQYGGIANPILSAYVNGLLASGNTSQKSWSLGARWDVAKNIAVKAQYDRIRPDHGSAAGLLISSDSKPLSSRHVATVAMDFVF